MRIAGGSAGRLVCTTFQHRPPPGACGCQHPAGARARTRRAGPAGRAAPDRHAVSGRWVLPAYTRRPASLARARSFFFCAAWLLGPMMPPPQLTRGPSLYMV